MTEIPLLLLAAVCVPEGHAWAGPREDAAAAMARCDTLRDNAAWLDCHERATAQMRAALTGSVPRPAPPAPVPGRAVATDVARFGADDLPSHPRAGGRAPRKLVARLENVTFSKSGYFTVGLDNGQWWRQIDGDTNYARFRTPASRNVITIEHGSLGSYNLHIQGLSQGYKVNRIR
jgi:hypothetical protein